MTAARQRVRPDLDEISAAVIAAFPKLSAAEQRVALALYRLLSKGSPATVKEISAAGATASDAVQEMLGRWHGVDRNPDGGVNGFWGLTLSETKHRFRIDGRQLHTWCAWDSLFLPSLLGAPAYVESTCPITGERIELTVGPTAVQAVQPATAALSFLVPRASEIRRSVTANFCCYVHFFASREPAERWVSSHSGTFVLALEEALLIGIRRNAAQFAAALYAPAPRP